jgi:hypothetical protein
LILLLVMKCSGGSLGKKSVSVIHEIEKAGATGNYLGLPLQVNPSSTYAFISLITPLYRAEAMASGLWTPALLDSRLRPLDLSPPPGTESIRLPHESDPTRRRELRGRTNGSGASGHRQERKLEATSSVPPAQGPFATFLHRRRVPGVSLPRGKPSQREFRQTT